jgi:hypothetical protein
MTGLARLPPDSVAEVRSMLSEGDQSQLIVTPNALEAPLMANE